jgi:deoxyribodipyrimidine photo-lyase
MSRAIIWFRQDQRLVDNEAVQVACASNDEVLPVFIVDPRQYGPSPFGFSRSGPFRNQFIREGLADLDAELQALGSALQVHVGEPAAVLRSIADRWGAHTVHAQQLFGWEERVHEILVAEHLDIQLHAPNTLLHPDDVPFALDALPLVFTAFRKQVEKQWSVRAELLPTTTINSPKDWRSQPLALDVLPTSSNTSDARRVMKMTGGRSAGIERLRHYCGPVDHLSHYKITRNELLGADNSSKLSPWLASGALGPREVYSAVKEHEAAHGANESTYWLIFELLWRDFFQFTAAKHGAHFFQRGGIGQHAPKGVQDAARFSTWSQGRTGQPFIDANMRELANTGWMSNRGRQNVASFLVNDLGVDWRMGAYWFEHNLVDYDPCSNWGNWQYLAGVGNDPREGRRFDPERQAMLYDPSGAYRAIWS